MCLYNFGAKNNKKQPLDKIPCDNVKSIETIKMCGIHYSYNEEAAYQPNITDKIEGPSQIPHSVFFWDMYHFMKVCTNLFFFG